MIYNSIIYRFHLTVSCFCSIQVMNPLFKGATTTVLNPLHSEDE